MIPRDPDVLLTMFGAIIVVVEGTVLVHLRPRVGAALFVAAAIAQSYSFPGAIGLLGFQVYLLDGVSAMLVATVLLRATRGIRLSIPVSGLGALLALSLLRGISSFGSQEAVNAGRSLLYLIVAVSFAVICLRDSCWEAVIHLWRVSAVVFLAFAALFLLRNGFGSYTKDGTRALDASHALLVGQAAVLGLADMTSRRQKIFVLSCFVTILFTQQRTVWAATLGAVVIVAIRSGQLGNRQMTRTLRTELLAGFAAVVGLLLVGPSALQASVGEATATASADSGTLGWRIQGWTSLLKTFGNKPIEDKLIGQPSGTGFDRVLNGAVVTVSPHNMYLYVLIALGFFGLALLGALLASALRQSHLVSVVLFALICGLLIYSMGYQLGPEQGLLLGAGLTVRRRSDAHQPAGAVAA
jgi:O-Antigen ligase